jgi:hypothetical protein
VNALNPYPKAPVTACGGDPQRARAITQDAKELGEGPLVDGNTHGEETAKLNGENGIYCAVENVLDRHRVKSAQVPTVHRMRVRRSLLIVTQTRQARHAM